MDEFGNRIMKWPANQALPKGWIVIQLDSGHYMGTNPALDIDTAITVNLFHARKWAIMLAKQNETV